MSIQIIATSPERILVGVDTMTVDAVSGRRFDSAKAVVLPHLNAVLSARGSAGVLYAVGNGLMLCATFDEAREALPAVANAVVARVRTDVADGPVHDHQELVLSGWSNGLQRMVAHCATQLKDGRSRSGELKGQVSGGWDAEASGPLPDASTPSAMLAVAAAAVRDAHRKMPGYPVGGSLVTFEITRTTMHISRSEIPA